jgi:iron only hydrogenase large subunit-like protein
MFVYSYISVIHRIFFINPLSCSNFSDKEAFAVANSSSAGGHFSQIKYDSTTKAASITLSDCLACSGCVTSAETVLITQQSSSELLTQLAASKAGSGGKSIFVVTVSPQSRTSVASHFGLSPIDAAKKISAFLRMLGVNYVMDSGTYTCALHTHRLASTHASAGAAMDIAQAESCEEFVSR